jgi:hypothetical protein
MSAMRSATLDDFHATAMNEATLIDSISAWGGNASASTLAGKSGGRPQVWRPIKNFLDRHTEVGLDRLVGAMATFELKSNAGVVTPAHQLSDTIDFGVAPIHMDKPRLGDRGLADFRAAHD